MTKFKAFFGLVLSLAIFTSCDKAKDDTQVPAVTKQDCLLSKVLDQNNNPVIEITYNSSKQPVTFLNHTYSDLFSYTYADNKLASVTFSHPKPMSSDFNQTYTVNADGLVTRQDFINPTTPTDHLFWLFDYDAEKRISRHLMYHQGSNGDPDDFREKRWFIYNAAGNREKVLLTNNMASEQDTVGYGYVYEYDTKPSPYYPLRNLPSNLNWSKNNVTKIVFTQYDSNGNLTSQTLEGNYQNEYNAEGLLTKSTYIPANGSAASIRKFEYVCN